MSANLLKNARKLQKFHYLYLQQSYIIFNYSGNLNKSVFDMNLVWLNAHNLQRMFLLITAHLFSRVLRRDLHAELERLNQQTKFRTFIEMTTSIVGIFAAAFIAASFGWIGLALYLLFAAILFY